MTVTFVISPGRCGTQWLASVLGRQLPAEYWVCHEPISSQYRPDINTSLAPTQINQTVLERHLSEIKNHLTNPHSGKQGHYIETGFPSWRHIQWYQQHLDCDINLIQVLRPALDNAQSLLTINAFVPPILPHMPIKNLYLPSQHSLFEPVWSTANWHTLNPLEKNLVYWAEVAIQARQYQQSKLAKQFICLHFKTLFTPQALQQIAQILAENINITADLFETTDNFKRKTFNQDWSITPVLLKKIAVLEANLGTSL